MKLLQNLALEKYTLSNGLDVILHEDHFIPMVSVNIWYHVGSKNEKRGRTGFAHLFERMIFEGSQHHDTEYFSYRRVRVAMSFPSSNHTLHPQATMSAGACFRADARCICGGYCCPSPCGA